ncbi:hypothetical protein HMPREF1326_03325 [Akkermansia sp. KLE1605]|nr:hypothetical protein HMPREF1326_03325 [Akkermansia sp. KLE1605]
MGNSYSYSNIPEKMERQAFTMAHDERGFPEQEREGERVDCKHAGTGGKGAFPE